MAARYAYEDACVDHAGDGIYAEQFLAALESIAFIENDMNKLLDAGLSVIPVDSRLSLAIKDTRQWCSELSDWLAIRQKILDKWGNENFTDTVMNIPFAVMALLLGEGDFNKTICLSVNCGRDADCTTATVGSILGIINSDCIDEKWLKSIGRKLVINDGITGISLPDTLDGFTDMIIDLRKRISCKAEKNIQIPDLSKHVIHAECGLFSPCFPQDEGKFAPKMTTETKVLKFPGTCGSIDANLIPKDSLYMMRFSFELKTKQAVRIMFNTSANSRVWIDGIYAFGREGGRMAPAFHRCPVIQYKDIDLEAGEHEFIVGISPVRNQKNIDWVIGVGDPISTQWLTNNICYFKRIGK